MKSVALDALVKILKGQSEHSRNAGLGLMEGRVETCDLRDVGPQLCIARIAALLEKLRIEFTKSRPRQTNLAYPVDTLRHYR